MKLELSGRRAIVTGAAQGIGRSIVQALHDDDDPRRITIISDDERPLVQYGVQTHITGRGE